MQWGFVDYENTGSLEAIDLGKYQRVFVFLGPKNTRLKFGEISNTGFCTLEIVSLSTMGPNNLDFHLAFHLGRHHESADEGTEFHIISNDSGFDGLVNHLRELGRKCRRVRTKQPEAPKAVSQLSPCAALVVERLGSMDGRKRPRKKAKLINWIKSQCAQLLDGAEPIIYYEELEKARIMRERFKAGKPSSWQMRFHTPEATFKLHACAAKNLFRSVLTFSGFCAGLSLCWFLVEFCEPKKTFIPLSGLEDSESVIIRKLFFNVALPALVILTSLLGFFVGSRFDQSQQKEID